MTYPAHYKDYPYEGAHKSLLNPTERIQSEDPDHGWAMKLGCIKLAPSSDTGKGPSGESKWENTCHSHSTTE